MLELNRGPLSWGWMFSHPLGIGLVGSPCPALRLMATNCHVVMESGTFTRMLEWEMLLEVAGRGRGITELVLCGQSLCRLCPGVMATMQGSVGHPMRGIVSRGSLFWGNHWDLYFHPGRFLSWDYAESSMSPQGALAMMDVH